MPNNAIFVSLKATYPELNEHRLGTDNSMLRRATCGWWRLNIDNCHEIEFIFGVIGGNAVTAYEVAASAPTWPRIHHPDAVDGSGGGRWFVPVKNPSEDLWAAKNSITHLDMRGGAVHYGAVVRNGSTFAARLTGVEKNDQ
jgi:hypothetical protein